MRISTLTGLAVDSEEERISQIPSSPPVGALVTRLPLEEIAEEMRAQGVQVDLLPGDRLQVTAHTPEQRDRNREAFEHAKMIVALRRAEIGKPVAL